MAQRMILGVQPIREALRAHGSAVERLLIADKANPRLEALGRFAADQGVAVERVRRADLDRRAGAGARHQGAIAFAPDLVVLDLDALIDSKPDLVVILDGITDPQNFGASLRSAVALGASAVMWAENYAAPLTPSTFRASAGAVEHARLCRVPSLRIALGRLNGIGLVTVALDASANVELPALDLQGPVALVIGSEDRGVGRGIRRICSHTARLPMSGRIDSLNASVASAVAIYEVIRQRKFKQ